MTPTEELLEYQSCEVDLDHEAVVRLRRASGRALTVSPTDHPGSWTIRAGSLVGTIVTPDVRVLIRPKVESANLFHLLEAGRDPLEVGAEVFDYETTRDMVPAFATFFARHLERAVTRGLVRTYREQDEPLVGIRGRVNLRSQVNRGGLPLPVDCRFDEHTADTQLNRIIAGALLRLARLPGVTTPTRRALLHLSPLFAEVLKATRADLERPTSFTRLDAHFRPTEHLARLVLAGSSLVDATGQAGAGSFLIDMNKVFERFVEDRLRRYLRGTVDVRGQAPATLDTGKHIRMRPDLLMRKQGTDVYVADAKYKLTADGYGRESDYYQLLAYCTSLGLPEGMLIYCHHDGTLPPQEAIARGPIGQHLVSAAIRLDGTPAQLEGRMRELATDIGNRLAARPLGTAPSTRRCN